MPRALLKIRYSKHTPPASSRAVARTHLYTILPQVEQRLAEEISSKEAVQRRIKELFTHFAATGVAANEAVALAMKQAQEEAAGGK